MTGRYLIYTPLESSPNGCGNGRRFQKNWHTFVEVCRSLHQDGLSYDVQLNLTASNPHVVILARGTAKPRKSRAAHRVLLPPPVPAQRCRDRALEVEWFLPENLGRRNNHTSY